MLPIIQSKVEVIIKSNDRSGTILQSGIVEIEIALESRVPATGDWVFTIEDYVLIPQAASVNPINSEEVAPGFTRQKLEIKPASLNKKAEYSKKVLIPKIKYDALMEKFDTHMPEASRNLRLAHGLLDITKADPVYYKLDRTKTSPDDYEIKPQA
ncbi:MAG: hypothetical protein HRT69_10905 [Flavobacteriaceae bacterium]|nr:hypothetical protein [Flavobacteriaceae bacterium]